ncbi:NAD(+) hydrolase SARM1-like isoform X3 [Dreissena polymorpha]|uniref:NAD(+) hydrolase SARM1-like isoform X3 n=1 Tax=Dreissena polymorpha TaxID=45954 RepID=UPI00226560C9|nr:NAD(+) hydrolase SARM1-like isoform X3 [Dreissena polymorpha]
MAEAKFDDIFEDSDIKSNEVDTIHYSDDERDSDSYNIDRFNSSIFPQRSQSDAELTRRDIQSILAGATSAGNFDELDSEPPLSGKRVSESARVFFDLSKIDQEIESSISTAASTKTLKDIRFRLRLNQSPLETIPQDEILVTKKKTKVSYSSLSSCTKTYSSDTLDDIEESDDSIEAEHVEALHVEHYGSYYSKYPLTLNVSQNSTTSGDNHASWQNKHNLKLKYQQFCNVMEKSITELKCATGSAEIKPLTKINETMEEAWNYKVYGRDLAYGLCDIIRNESVLSLLIKNCESDCKEILIATTSLLEQVMSYQNRVMIAEEGLEVVVRMTQKNIGEHNLAMSMTGILENLFKVSEEVSKKVIEFGGLDTILHWSRSTDVKVLRRCAKALSNLSLFGGPENQQTMTHYKVPEWLFPLAFMEDKHIKYYACLSIAVLVANKELEAQVMKSGTLELVLPFVSTEKPDVFAHSDYSHQQGRDPVWLAKLKPLLYSRRPEAQALAAFHFAMEAAIKSEQGKNDVFYDIEVVEPLRKVASSPNAVASRLAREALQLIGEDIPHKLSQQVPIWTTEDVAHWVSQIGFDDYSSRFEECKIDGDMLLQMTESDLVESINMVPGMIRKRFQRELVNLKITADYSSCDPTKIDPWLMSILPDLSQYAYTMLRSGMDRTLLSTTTEEELKSVCGIDNGIHRRIIMGHLSGLPMLLDTDVLPASTSQRLLFDHPPDLPGVGALVTRPSIDCGASLSVCPRMVDVFISYRRSTGSQLASLLKVHLQLRGFSVFLDIDRLRAGKFDENLLLNIKLAKHFLLVLTSNALDRCVNDFDRTDWVHKEIVTALNNQCNIIPILDNCEWPEPEQLPEDMRQVCYFNGIRWVHEYQDACINKLESFLRGQIKMLPDKMCQPKVLYKSTKRGSQPNLYPQCTFDLPVPSDWNIEDAPIIGSLVDP